MVDYRGFPIPLKNGEYAWYGRENSKALKKSKRGILEPLETAYCG